MGRRSTEPFANAATADARSADVAQSVVGLVIGVVILATLRFLLVQ